MIDLNNSGPSGHPIVTLVDQVENQLLNYFKENNLCAGSPVPNEIELAATLKVGRSVLREALSRLKMIGMIESRTKRGMILREPSLLEAMRRINDPRVLGERTLLEILEFRIALEVGICMDVVNNATDQDIHDLESIVKINNGLEGNNEYSVMAEFMFHSKLYELTNNSTIIQFQGVIKPMIAYIKERFCGQLEPINRELKERGELVTHDDLLQCVKRRDSGALFMAMSKHFQVYKIFLRQRMERV